MTRLRLFAQARDAAGGVREAEIEGGTVGEVLDAAAVRFGDQLGRVIDTSAVWLNGEETTREAPVSEGDEVAILPPVSGGG